MQTKAGMHQLRGDLVSEMGQPPGPRGEHQPQAFGTLLSRVQSSAGPSCKLLFSTQGVFFLETELEEIHIVTGPVVLKKIKSINQDF